MLRFMIKEYEFLRQRNITVEQLETTSRQLNVTTGKSLTNYLSSWVTGRTDVKKFRNF